jgi:hypothetical protein
MLDYVLEDSLMMALLCQTMQEFDTLSWTVHFLADVLISQNYVYLYVFGATAPPPVGQGLLIHEVSRSHTTMHHGR